MRPPEHEPSAASDEPMRLRIFTRVMDANTFATYPHSPSYIALSNYLDHIVISQRLPDYSLQLLRQSSC